jgi:hypothetical protein
MGSEGTGYGVVPTDHGLLPQDGPSRTVCVVYFPGTGPVPRGALTTTLRENDRGRSQTKTAASTQAPPWRASRPAFLASLAPPAALRSLFSRPGCPFLWSYLDCVERSGLGG